VFSSSSLGEEGRESVVFSSSSTIHQSSIRLAVSCLPFNAVVSATYTQSVFDSVQLPAGVTDLDTC
jgi:hypothetical protein